MRKISCVLVVAMICSMFQTVAFAAQQETNEEQTVKKEITMISSDLSNISYKYVEDGVEFLVVEHTNENLTQIESCIYRYEDSIYKLEREISTKIIVENEGELRVESAINGVVSVHTIPVSRESGGTVSISLEETECVAVADTLTDGTWKKVYSGTGDNTFEVVTYSIVVAVLSGAICSVILGYIPATIPGYIAGAIEGGVSGVAGVVVSLGISQVWYRYDNYYFYPDDTFRPWYEKYYFKYYLHKNMLDNHFIEEMETEPIEINYT